MLLTGLYRKHANTKYDETKHNREGMAEDDDQRLYR